MQGIDSHSRHLEVPSNWADIAQRHHDMPLAAQRVAEHQFLESHLRATNIQACYDVKNTARLTWAP
jgi:hypothetical protein